MTFFLNLIKMYAIIHYDWAFLGMYRLPRGLFVYAIYISANDYKIHNVVKQGRWGKKGDDVSFINAATTMIRESTM